MSDIKIPAKIKDALGYAEKDWLANEGATAAKEYQKYSQDFIYPCLIDVINDAFAYQYKINEVALQAFINTYDARKLSDLATNEDYIDATSFNMKQNVLVSNPPFSDSKWQKTFSNLVLSHLSLSAQAKDRETMYHSDSVLRSAGEQIKQVYIPAFTSYRKRKAKQIVEKYDLKNKLRSLGYDLDSIQQLAFDSLQTLIKTDTPHDFTLVKLFRFIEYVGIQKALAGFVEDLGFTPTNLLTLRKSVNPSNQNTICELCFRPTHKRIIKQASESVESCTKHENQNCFRNKMRRQKFQRDEIENIRHGNKCSNEKCKNSPSPKYYFVGKFYCSEKCYHTQRIREYRHLHADVTKY